MKPYFFGLALLFLFSVFNRVMSIIMGTPTAVMLSYAADITLFALCLRVAYDVAFNRRYFAPETVRLIYWGVMTLGVLSALMLTKGEFFGLPDLDIHMLPLILWFLPYPLFALPCILMQRTLREKEDASKG